MKPADSGSDEDLWARVQDALDRREDPLADPELAERLAERPELALEVLALASRLDRLGAGPVALPVRRPRRLATRAGGLAALLAAGIALAALFAIPDVVEKAEEPAATAPPEDATVPDRPGTLSRVLGSRIRIVVESPPPAGPTSGTTKTRVVRTSVAGIAPGSPVARSRITISEETWSPWSER